MFQGCGFSVVKSLVVLGVVSEGLINMFRDDCVNEEALIVFMDELEGSRVMFQPLGFSIAISLVILERIDAGSSVLSLSTSDPVDALNPELDGALMNGLGECTARGVAVLKNEKVDDAAVKNGARENAVLETPVLGADASIAALLEAPGLADDALMSVGLELVCEDP